MELGPPPPPPFSIEPRTRLRHSLRWPPFRWSVMVPVETPLPPSSDGAVVGGRARERELEQEEEQVVVAHPLPQFEIANMT